MSESKKFFEVLSSSAREHVPEKLVMALPDQFKVIGDTHGSSSVQLMNSNVPTAVVPDEGDDEEDAFEVDGDILNMLESATAAEP